jgi:predicted DNA-binding ribbon-helix-helix protein
MSVKDLKRSLTLQGHRTSVSLEPEFWKALRTLATNQQKSLAALIVEVDASRGDRNLSSALRLYILKALQTPGKL